MKFFVKKDGQMVEATAEQVMSSDEILYNEGGEALNQRASNGPVEELTGTVKELFTAVEGLKGLKEQQEEMASKMAAYEEAAKKGFPIPSFPGGTEENEDEAKIYRPFDLAKQGKGLLDRHKHPIHQITEDKREEMAKFFILFFKAAYMQDPMARMKFREKYGEATQETKTAIGDTGNVFPVPDIVDEEILAFSREKSVVLQYARIWDMISEIQSFPSETGQSTTAWGNTTTQSDPAITEVELTAKELSAFTEVRNTTLGDARSDIVSWLTEMMAEAAGQELDNEAFNGDGSNLLSGIMTANAGYSVVMSTSTIADLSAADLSNMIAKLDGLRKQGARFWMNGAILHYIRTLADSQSRPIFIERIGAPMDATVYGYPYTEVVKCPSTDAANTALLAFGNLRYLAVGRRLGVTALQVDPYGLWTTNRTRFKIYQRWAMQLGLTQGFCRLVTGS